MTSEAKIGLLLGLVFIFIIAFVINGLPSFWDKTNSNELTIAAGNTTGDTLGLGEVERSAQEAIDKIESSLPQTPIETQNPQGDVRFVAELPKDFTKAIQTTELQQTTVAQTVSPEKTPEISSQIATRTSATEQTYVVCSGDSLYTIAKKFYGAEEANKKATIDMLFRANQNTMKSPHLLQIGQKLVIPPLSGKSAQKDRVENVSATTTKKTQSVARQQSSVDSTTPKQIRDYVVQSGDSLWSIAAKQLGNGNRYDEIIELNSDVLTDEDNLTIGMHLKLPVR